MSQQMSQGREQHQETQRSQSPIMLQDQVNRSSPAQLQVYLESKYEIDELSPEVPEEDGSQEETEVDEFDEDGYPEEDLDELKLERPLSKKSSGLYDAEQADAYLLGVWKTTDNANYYRCEFLAPGWMRGYYRDEQSYLDSFRWRLSCIAKWFEEQKQKFLEKPTYEHFLEGETLQELEEKPIVTQKGFVARLEEDLRGFQCDTTVLNKFASNVSLDFSGFRLPLLRLFSREARLTASLHLLSRLCSEACFCEDNLTYPNKDELKRAKRNSDRPLKELSTCERKVVIKRRLYKYMKKLTLQPKQDWETAVAGLKK